MDLCVGTLRHWGSGQGQFPPPELRPQAGTEGLEPDGPLNIR